MTTRGPTGKKNAATANWTDERVAQLTQLWADGLSCSRIGAIMGITKNAVIGKVQRLKLQGRKPKETLPLGRKPKPTTQTPQKKQSFTPKRKSKLGLPVFTPVPEFNIEKPKGEAWKPIEGTTPVSLVDLERDQCKWPVTEDAPFLFCGAQSTHGPYCHHHHLWSIGQGTAFERSAESRARLAVFEERVVYRPDREAA